MITRRTFLGTLGASAVGLAGCLTAARRGGPPPQGGAAAGPAPAAARPNFIFVLIDDMGWRDAACFGSTFYETPGIDRLAAQGMRFTDAYAACPVCSPTRASIMTGKYPARLGLTDFIPGRGEKRAKLLPAKFRQEMPLEEVTIAEALKEAGYATACIGKWHLGGPRFYPESQGFDVNVAACSMGGPATYFDPYKIPTLPDRRQGEYLTDRLTDEACAFIEANRGRPFFLYLSHYAVHIPLQAKKDLADKYRAKAAGLPRPSTPVFGQEGKHKVRLVQDQPVYAGMVESVDESVDRIMKRLEALGMADRTVCVFMSDNGGVSTAEGTPTSNSPLRAGKGWLYEGGIREPMIVKWPGAAKPGTVCSVPVTSTDFYPTILAMAGLAPRPEQHADGVSLVPLLRGGTLQRGPLFWHYPHYSNQGGTPTGAIRDGDYKLIEFFEDDHVELYNLKDDLGEERDLAAAMPEKARQLRARLAAWRRSVGALMPAPNPDFEPGKADKRVALADAAYVLED
jgi:arylsulfatase A-like enzyme